MDWNMATVVAALAVVYVLHAHWQAQRRAWPAWTLRLSDTRRALVQWLRLNTGAHLETLEGTLRVARADHDREHSADALHVIGQADKLAALHVQLLRTWLERWADVAGLLRLSPAPPPPAGPVQIPPLRGLAWLQLLGDALLPTRAWRFRANVRLQRLALKWAGWNAGAAWWRARRAGGLGQALDQLEVTHADLVALDGQALVTLEHVLHALPPDPRTGTAG